MVKIKMSASILSGRIVRDHIIPRLKGGIGQLPYIPTLAIIQVGERLDSTSYIGAKKLFAQKIGISVKHIQLPESISEKDLLLKVKECNSDNLINAIIVQLPLPVHINRDSVIEVIEPKKDADGLTKDAKVMPATARGIKELLKYYNIDLNNKKVTVIGRSDLVGKPVANMCKIEGAIVTVCHRGTLDLVKDTKESDILIVAAGKSNLIGKEHVKEGQIIIDVGINSFSGKGFIGDVDFNAIKDIVSSITPVPGGVGPMTVTALFENILDLCRL